MYLFLLLTVFLFILNGLNGFCRFLPSDGTYITRERTCLVNGVFSILVFICHCSQCYYGAPLYQWERIPISMLFNGQLIVSTFFFYSGYGLMSSMLKKGTPYAVSLLSIRIPKLLLHFAVAVLIFWAADVLILNNPPSYSKLFLSLITWKSIGNSNWFITMTLLAYLLIGLSFRMFMKHSLWTSIFCTISLMLVLLYIINIVKPSYYVDTLLCIPAGMIFCIKQNRIETLLRHIRIPTLFIGLFCCLTGLYLYVLCAHKGLPILCNLGSICYAFGITLTQGCFLLKRCHPFPVWLGGSGLFTFYIFQRLPMAIFNEWGLSSFNREIYITVTFLSTCAIAYAFSYLFRKIDTLCFRKS